MNYQPDHQQQQQQHHQQGFAMPPPMAPPSSYDSYNNSNNTNYNNEPTVYYNAGPSNNPSSTPSYNNNNNYYHPPSPTASRTGTSTTTTSTTTTTTVTSTTNNNSNIILDTQPKEMTQDMMNILTQQGYTRGLIDAYQQTMTAFPLRIWLIDNSGSMNMQDGTKIDSTPVAAPTKAASGSGQQQQQQQQQHFLTVIPNVSRWIEMQQTIEYHARIAACIHAPTMFRFLNNPGINAGPQYTSIGVKTTNTSANNNNSIENELDVVLQTISKTAPGGVTPLVQHMKDIKQIVLDLEPQLRASGTKIAIIVATDGIPSDNMGISSDIVKQEFEQTLRSMEGLPIWLVVRLFTNDTDVVQFWNDIDSKIELSFEVIDDFVSESKEIYAQNKWLTYGLPLHRIREFGYSNYILDIVDEKPLSKDEIRQYCKILLGHGIIDEAPDANVNWKGFYDILYKSLTEDNANAAKIYDPIDKRLELWIDMKQLKKEYGGGTRKRFCFCF